MKTSLFFFLIPALFIFSACSSKQEKTELKSPLEVLNGKAYGVDRGSSQHGENGSLNNFTGIPATGRKNQVTRIRGTLMMGEGVSGAPLKFTTVKLMDEKGKVVGDATTDIRGAFVLSGIFFNGPYTIEVDSKNYTGTTPIFINSYDQEVTNQTKPR
jgi:hypothetical protein